MENKRVDIKKILADPVQCRKLLDRMVEGLIKVGRDGTHVPDLAVRRAASSAGAEKKMIGRFDYEFLNVAMREHGWIITGVPNGALYTVGLTGKMGHPEFLMQGLDAKRMFAVLGDTARQVLGGRVFEPGVHTGVIQNMPVKMIEVSNSNYDDWLGQAVTFVGPELRVLQILWPDRAGRFPGDPEYDVLWFGMQLRFDVRRPEYDDVDLPEGWPN